MTEKRKYGYHTKEPTDRYCVYCKGIIYTLYDDDGVCVFNGRYRIYCHRPLCQKRKKVRAKAIAPGWEKITLGYEAIL